MLDIGIIFLISIIHKVLIMLLMSINRVVNEADF